MCEECFGVPYKKKQERVLNFGLRYGARANNSVPEIQNMKAMTLEDAQRFLDQFGKLFPEAKEWRERRTKFLQVNFAEVEKRFLAHLESQPADQTVQDLFLRSLFNYSSPSGRFSGSHPNQANTNSSHSSPTNSEPAPTKG